MGEWFAPNLAHLPIDVILPVPLHKSKLRKRTYNQSECIAIGISNVLNIQVNNLSIMRTMSTQSQTKKAKVDRWKNMQNVYAPVTDSLDGLSVLVIDDVITTGATCGMLCDRLVQAEVGQIHIASIARVK